MFKSVCLNQQTPYQKKRRLMLSNLFTVTIDCFARPKPVSRLMFRSIVAITFLGEVMLAWDRSVHPDRYVLLGLRALESLFSTKEQSSSISHLGHICGNLSEARSDCIWSRNPWCDYNGSTDSAFYSGTWPRCPRVSFLALPGRGHLGLRRM